MNKYDPEETFRSTAPFYAKYRAGYPPEFFAYLCEAQRLDGTQRVLDLGCGTGQVAVPLSTEVGEVLAIDPQQEMLDWGQRRAAESGVDNVRWTRGDSTMLGELELGQLDLVTMGASFHWMDRDAVLRTLDGLVKEGGAVVVVSGGAPDPDATPPAWEKIVRTVRERYLGPERRAGSGTYSHPPDRHQVVLARSPFSAVTSQVWNWEMTRDIASVVGLQLSYSYSAPALLGERLDDFVRDLEDEIGAAYPSGKIIERIQTEALLARRP